MIADRSVTDQDDESGYWWTDAYQTLQCRGCGHVCLRHVSSDAAGDEDISYYPPRVSRRAPSWRYHLPEEMSVVLAEIYRALHADCRRLALMGARTLVDMLMVRQVGDVGSFQHKLKELTSQGVIAARNADVLEAALDAGSATAHRGYDPEAEDLTAVMDIVENVLQAVYHLEKVAARLKTTTPPRPPKP